MAIMRSSTSSNSDSEQSPLGPAQAYHDSARAQEMALDSELVGSEGVVESVTLGNMHGPGEPWHEYKFIQESGLCCSMAGDSESEVLLDEDFDPDSKSSVESEDESGGDSDLAASTSDSETENETDLALAPVDSADESEEVQVRVQEAEGSNLNTLDHSWEARKPPIVELARCALRDLKLILKPPRETGRGQKDPQLEWMSSFLWIYTDDNTPCSGGTNGSRWTSASLQAAHAQQSTPYRARNLRKWSKAFINDRKALPLSENGKSPKLHIDDDDIAMDIALHLQGLGQYVRAQDIPKDGCRGWAISGQRNHLVNIIPSCLAGPQIPDTQMA
ncbi:hypothetical protein V8E55_003461 [Tylopilus felleus]